MQGKKTHEQQLRILERKADVPHARELAAAEGRNPDANRHREPRQDARESEFSVSRGGLNQESDHNKHNDGGQRGHAPTKPMPAQQKH